MSRFLLSSACLGFALVAGGCSDDSDNFPSPLPPGSTGPTGTLVFDWSIEGRQDADACVEAGATSFGAILVDEGFVIRDVSVPCEDFEARVELYVDDFLARSSLLDDNRRPALGRIIEDLFLIDENKETRLILDFPLAAAPMDPVPDAGVPVPPPDAGPVAAPDAGAPPDEPPPDETTDAGASDAAAP